MHVFYQTASILHQIYKPSDDSNPQLSSPALSLPAKEPSIVICHLHCVLLGCPTYKICENNKMAVVLCVICGVICYVAIELEQSLCRLNIIRSPRSMKLENYPYSPCLLEYWKIHLTLKRSTRKVSRLNPTSNYKKRENKQKNNIPTNNNSMPEVMSTRDVNCNKIFQNKMREI